MRRTISTAGSIGKPLITIHGTMDALRRSTAMRGRSATASWPRARLIYTGCTKCRTATISSAIARAAATSRSSSSCSRTSTTRSAGWRAGSKAAWRRLRASAFRAAARSSTIRWSAGGRSAVRHCWRSEEDYGAVGIAGAQERGSVSSRLPAPPTSRTELKARSTCGKRERARRRSVFRPRPAAGAKKSSPRWPPPGESA